jgi:hypothetical protein
MSISPHRYHHLKERLHKHVSRTRNEFALRFPHAVKKLKHLKLDLKDLRRHSANILSAAAIAGGVFTTSPAIQSKIHPITHEEKLNKDQLATILHSELTTILPSTIGKPISPETEARASEVIYKTLGIKAVATLDGNHLPTSYGYFGQEQHLPRYPGDTLAQHDALKEKGITANRGGFGYFAYNKASMSHEAYLREKYYIAAPIMYLPNWKKDLRYLVNFYKFRRFLVVNPKNGKSAVAVLGDAGPAAWTGKQFGGSPELMEYLEMKDGKQKGGALVFFIDEPGRPIALGPIEEKQATFIARR